MLIKARQTRCKLQSPATIRRCSSQSSVRVRVEHIFGAQANDMGGTLVRTIGMVRAKAKIGMKNLAYNMRRLVATSFWAMAIRATAWSMWSGKGILRGKSMKS